MGYIVCGRNGGSKEGHDDVLTWKLFPHYWPFVRGILHWKFNQHANIFLQENTFENVICKIAAILSIIQCVLCYLASLSPVGFTWGNVIRGVRCSNLFIFWTLKITTIYPRNEWVSWLAPVRCSCNLKLVIFKLMSRIEIISIFR